MRIMRLGRIQSALQPQLARRGHQQILPAHNMRDALRRIIGHHRQLISPKAVGTQQHKITDVVRQILRIMADHRIIKADDFIRHAHAPGRRFVQSPLRIQPGAATVVHKTIRPRTRRRLPIFAAAITGINQPFCFQTA